MLLLLSDSNFHRLVVEKAEFGRLQRGPSPLNLVQSFPKQVWYPRGFPYLAKDSGENQVVRNPLSFSKMAQKQLERA